jgi:hypothetical protein
MSITVDAITHEILSDFLRHGRYGVLPPVMTLTSQKAFDD